ncbi:MAG: aspartate aminotransferase family protein [Sphingobacterium sp.]
MELFNVYPLNPINIESAKGSHVWDDQGNKYLDLYGGHAVISIGHTHPHYVTSIHNQLQKIGFYSNSIVNPLQDQLAKQLGQVSNKQDYKLFLVNSGAEANENALKLASFHTGRKKIVAFHGAFHGRTSLAVAATDNPKIVAPVNQTDQVVFLPFNDVDALQLYFDQQGENIAAVIVEGIQGVGGIREASTLFLQAIRKHCDRAGAIFIADSVQCGYGRTGDFFSHDYSGVQADIYTIAKGMGNGFPIGGLVISPRFEASFGLLGTTFGGNHLACAAAIAVLDIIEQDQLLIKARELGEYLKTELATFDEVVEVRGRGMMIGIELPEHLSHVRKDLLMKDRIFTGEAKPNVIRLLPALNLNKEHADYFLQAFQERLKA